MDETQNLKRNNDLLRERLRRLEEDNAYLARQSRQWLLFSAIISLVSCVLIILMSLHRDIPDVRQLLANSNHSFPQPETTIVSDDDFIPPVVEENGAGMNELPPPPEPETDTRTAPPPPPVAPPISDPLIPPEPTRDVAPAMLDEVSVPIPVRRPTGSSIATRNPNPVASVFTLPKSTERPEPILYRIRRHDTLGKIAERFLGSYSKYKKIMKDNNLQSTKNLRPGKVLKIYLDE